MAKNPEPTNVGHLFVNPTPFPNFWFNYDVLYFQDDLAVVHGCTEFWLSRYRYEQVWFLMRKPNKIGSGAHK